MRLGALRGVTRTAGTAPRPVGPRVAHFSGERCLVASCSNGPTPPGDAGKGWEQWEHPELNADEEPYHLPKGWADGYLGGTPRPAVDDSWDFASDDGHVPSPSNLPTEDSGWTFSGLKDVWTTTDQPGIDLLSAGPAAISRLSQQAFVILFGVGERETEGIYSLRTFDKDGLAYETIILFEEEEDALRYAGLLEATMDHIPNVCGINPKELLDFCSEQGYRCRLEPTGSLLIPPDYNVNVTDWERSMRLRDGRFAVLESEPEMSPRSSQSGAPSTSDPPTPASLGLRPANPHAAAKLTNYQSTRQGPGPQASGLARAALFGEGELDDIRERLERLLHASGDGSNAPEQLPGDTGNA